MTLAEIQAAVLNRRTVHWANASYRVERDALGQWLIVCRNGSTIGLTWRDGVTLNGDPDDFFVADDGSADQ